MSQQPNQKDEPDPNPVDSGGIDNTAIAVALSMLLVYLILNIVGTVYFVKLQKLNTTKTKSSSSRTSGALASVILGWLLCPLVNITSPIMFAADK